MSIELPQPGGELEMPTMAKLAANASLSMCRDAAGGDGMVQNGVSSVFPTVAQFGLLLFLTLAD